MAAMTVAETATAMETDMATEMVTVMEMEMAMVLVRSKYPVIFAKHWCCHRTCQDI
jgi:hypothetical protein